jgi:hypothetical protein
MAAARAIFFVRWDYKNLPLPILMTETLGPWIGVAELFAVRLP